MLGAFLFFYYILILPRPRARCRIYTMPRSFLSSDYFAMTISATGNSHILEHYKLNKNDISLHAVGKASHVI